MRARWRKFRAIWRMATVMRRRLNWIGCEMLAQGLDDLPPDVLQALAWGLLPPDGLGATDDQWEAVRAWKANRDATLL